MSGPARWLQPDAPSRQDDQISGDRWGRVRTTGDGDVRVRDFPEFCGMRNVVEEFRVHDPG